MTWSAWYADATYFSQHTSWQELPATGLQVVVVHHADGTRTIYDGADWIWLEGGQFHFIASAPEWDTEQPAPTVQCLSCIKQGTRLPDADYLEIREAALAYRPSP